MFSPLPPSSSEAQIYSSSNRIIFTLINQVSLLLLPYLQRFQRLQEFLGIPMPAGLGVIISTITFKSLKLNVNCTM
jgi:hypothetical protein